MWPGWSQYPYQKPWTRPKIPITGSCGRQERIFPGRMNYTTGIKSGHLPTRLLLHSYSSHCTSFPWQCRPWSFSWWMPWYCCHWLSTLFTGYWNWRGLKKGWALVDPAGGIQGSDQLGAGSWGLLRKLSQTICTGRQNCDQSGSYQYFSCYFW